LGPELIMKEKEFIESADRYLNGELSTSERVEFEKLCEQDEKLNSLFLTHKDFVATLREKHTRADVKAKLAKVMTQESSQGFFFNMWKNLKINGAAAAAVAILSSVATLYLSGYFSSLRKTTSEYSALKREINNVKRNVNAHNQAINTINKESQTNQTALQYGATGFMLTKDGYVVTNYHVVNGADSIHLQNSQGESFRASIIHIDPSKDLAILHISDTSFNPISLPYTFSNQSLDLGEGIFTIGYPRDEAVYGEGYLSSATGYSGDTTAYQISIPVNPGNSGGPVLDKNGHIIGIISGKQKGLDGAAFAIKTKALMETLDNIPENSLKGKIKLSSKNSLANLPRTEQIKKMQNYIYIVKVY